MSHNIPHNISHNESNVPSTGVKSTPTPKVIVIGLDGSSWDLVRPLADNGTLPNIARLMRQGASGELQSTNPAHSAPAWTTFATGVDPTQHGCLDFLTVQNNIDDLRLIDSAAIPQETIYEAMARQARRPILINLPNTYPPRLTESDHAITITSLMTRGEQFIFPESLKNTYPSLRKYRLSPNPKLRLQDNFEPYVKDLCDLERDRIIVAKDLFTGEDWDFFFFLSSGTDWVSHVVYDKALLEQYPPAIAMWEIMDEFIGWVDAHKDDNTTLLIMSDHGFAVYNHIFYINRWLEEQGYLFTTEGSGSFQQEHTQLSKEIGKVQRQRAQLKVGKRLRGLFTQSRTLEKIAKWIYFKIVKRFIPISVQFDVKLDIPKTQVAFPRGSMATMLYVNDTARFRQGLVDPAQRQKIADQVAEQLRQLKDASGRTVLKAVYTKDELYGQAGLNNAPDLFLQPGEYYLSGSLHSATLFENTKKNYHDERGMIIVSGPHITNTVLSNAHIKQIPPTILQAMRLPLLHQFVGQPLPVFSSHSELAQVSYEPPREPRSQPQTKPQSERTEMNSLIDDINI